MPDREKVEEWARDFKTYVDELDIARDDYRGIMEYIEDALALLREQEPLTIHDPGAICPNCKWPLYPEDHPNYCGNCGRKVKWDADDRC